MASYLKASIQRSYAESFLSELERNENQYFFFIGKGSTWANENSPPNYTDTVSSEYQVMHDAIGYKKLDPKNVLFALPRYEWTSGTTYDQYDDAVDLFDENDPSIFYVVTNENNVYKCIGNKNAALPSTIKPTQVTPGVFTTADGYQWQYLSTIKETDLPYELTDYIPVDVAFSETDTDTQNQYNSQINSVAGGLTRIAITNSSGSSLGKYPYAVSSSIVGGNVSYVLQVGLFETESATRKRIRITDPVSRGRINTAQLTNYIGHIIRVDPSTTRDVTQINNYGVIVGAASTANEIIFTVQNDATDFVVTPSSPLGIASVEILPYVKIVGNGSGAYAFPTMNSDTSISAVTVIGRGQGYSKVTAEVVSAKASGTQHPQLRVVLPPKGGHGSNILKELNVKDVLIIIEITEDDAQKILVGGTYRQFGIVKNPKLLDGSNQVAGSDKAYYRDISLIPVNGILQTSYFSGEPYNFLIGHESNSIAKIVSVKSTANNRITVKTKNSYGRMISRSDRPNEYTLTVGNGTSTVTPFLFLPSETVTQTVPAGTTFGVAGISYGFDFVVSGTVINLSGNSLDVRITSDGNFVSGATPIVGSVSGTTATVENVSSRYGEYAIVTTGNESAAVFSTNNTNLKLHKVVDFGSAYYDQNNTPTYSGLHVLSISTSTNLATGAIDTTSAPVTQTSFSSGDTVYQGSTGTVGNFASGKVYNWEYINRSFGRLYLTDVLGSFRSVNSHGLTGTTLGAYIVAGVSLPDIDPTSGEVLYIDNVRPISRISGQQEEFRVRLGF